MTKLLVSVRNAAEALDALEGGAHLIDVKEPRRGSLGKADPQVWREVVEAIDSRAPVSVALGELRDGIPHSDTPLDLSGVHFAKLGLAGCAADPAWPTRWDEALASLPASVNRVAVAYADWRQAESPSPRDVIEVGRRLGCTAWLIDTYGKHAGGLLDHLELNEFAQLISLARGCGMKTVIAGSLTKETIPRVLELSPDYVAVRGAVCRGDRTGVLVANLVRELAAMLESSPHAPRGEASSRGA